MAPLSLLDKLKSYRLAGHHGTPEPILSARSSALLSILFTCFYVLPFYLSRKTRPSPTLNRDAPSVIRARIQSITIALTISLLITFYLLHFQGKLPISTTCHLLGLYPLQPWSILKSCFLTLILYLAPLYDRLILEQDLSPLSAVPSRLRSSLASSQGYRNFVAGPLSEELLFRSIIISIHLVAHVSPTKTVWLTPLYFGIAHVHHFYEFRLTHPDTPVAPALLRSLFQFAYTTIFGWYTSFIYVRTGNLYVVFVIHSFCNWVGLPRLWGKVRLRTEPSASSVIVRGKEDTNAILPGSKSKGFDVALRCTIIYYALLFAGIVGFYWQFWPLTAGAEALADFTKRK